MLVKDPKIVVIGGGTGSFTLLQGLKYLTPNITAIVNMSDDGGSTGQLRDKLGVLPPGDIRQCLVALSNLKEVRELFNYRFGKGFLKGHSLGNVIISGLDLQYEGDFTKAISVASKMLNITGKVVPITLQNHTLILKDGDKIIKGEAAIGGYKIKTNKAIVTHKPKAHINPKARSAIISADLVVIAPGNLWQSLLPALSVDGVKDAFSGSKAKKIMVANLINKPRHTANWHVVDYVKEIEKYIGANQIGYVLYNDRSPSKSLLNKYAEEGELPVDNKPSRLNEIKAEAVSANLISTELYKPDLNDTLHKRTFIRHDELAVSRELLKILKG